MKITITGVRTSVKQMFVVRGHMLLFLVSFLKFKHDVIIFPTNNVSVFINTIMLSDYEVNICHKIETKFVGFLVMILMTIDQVKCVIRNA